MIHRSELTSMMALALLALGLVLLSGCGSPAEKLNQDGNEAFAKQAFDDALQAYESAKIESPELAEPYYNAANALYRQEKYAEALGELQKALAYAEDQTLAESSFYNMGNSSFNTQEWEAAIDAYTEALLLNPDDEDAKHNLEVALLQQQQQQQEQENQDQQQEQSENSESQQEQDQNQQEEGDQSEEGDQEQEQDQPPDGDQQQEQDQSQESDQQQEQDQSQEGDQQEEQNQEQNGDQSQNNDQQNPEDQQDQNQQSGQGQPQDGQQDANEQPRPGQMPPPGQRMTEEQARQLLEAIAQDSDTLQERLGQFFFVPAGPPVQDW